MVFRYPQFLWSVSYSCSKYFNALSRPVSHRVRILLGRSLFHFRPSWLLLTRKPSLVSF